MIIPFSVILGVMVTALVLYAGILYIAREARAISSIATGMHVTAVLSEATGFFQYMQIPFWIGIALVIVAFVWEFYPSSNRQPANLNENSVQ